jgi:hypothetical protein
VGLINVEMRIAADHPIRAIKRMCDEALRAMDQHFDEIYGKRPVGDLIVSEAGVG